METTRYDRPNALARAGNTLIRRLAEAGISIAGSQVLRVRGRSTGVERKVVINLMTVDGVDYLVSPRGNTHWARNARAAATVELGPRWKSRAATLTEVADEAKPPLLKHYLDRWFWEVQTHVGGLTPDSSPQQMREVASSIPVFAVTY
ncbi:nitroreductase/quinone reductase family protein [soil metagenome]